MSKLHPSGVGYSLESWERIMCVQNTEGASVKERGKESPYTYEYIPTLSLKGKKLKGSHNLR